MRPALAAAALAALAPVALAAPAGAAVPATFSSAGTFVSSTLTAVPYYSKKTGALTRLDLNATEPGQLVLAGVPDAVWHNGMSANGDCSKGQIQASDQTGEGTGTVTASCDRVDAEGKGARFTFMYGWSGLTTPNCVAVSEVEVRVDSLDEAGSARCLASVSAVSLPIVKKGGTRAEAGWSDVTASFVATGNSSSV